MTKSERSRIVFTAAVGAVAAIGLLVSATDAQAGRRKKKRKRVNPAEVRSLQTPLGLQGSQGAGNNVVSPFSLVDKSRRKSDIDAEYGWDVNGDGIIADGSDPNLPSEYFPATEDPRDPRNTRKNKKPQLFTTAGSIGSSHAFVWKSESDVGSAHFPTIQILHTPQGRPVPDPNNPGSFLFDDSQAGVKVRIRARAKKGGAVSEWAYTDAFALNNNTPPSMTIDAVVPNTTSSPVASDEIVEIRWTAFDEDSEDKNGNGILDPLDLEDRNANGVLDAEFVAVAFDYWRVPEGEDPSTYSDEQLAGLIWQPCTRADGVGDPDDGVPSAPEGVGRQHTFAWDSLADVGTARARYILRAKPFDVKRESGAIVYFRDGFQLDNQSVFNHPNTNADLPAGRVGTASVNLTPGLPRSDPLYEPPLQSFLLTGGALQADGPGSNYLAVVIANTETAETTTANSVPFTTLNDARSYHTATLLDDGRVLLAGGFDAGGNPVATTEIYDPATHTISPGPQLLAARAKHAAVKLANGDVLFVGGIGGSGAALASAEVYQFTPFGEPTEPNTAIPPISVAQHSAHAVLLPDQTVLVTGGVTDAGTSVQSAQVLDTLRDLDTSNPRTKDPDWITVGSMNEARKLASATPLTQGHVLFAGGGSPAKASMEVFNWETRQFEMVEGAGMPDGARADHVGALLGDGTVLLAGGTTDPNAANGLVPEADVFRLGERNDAAGTWAGSFLPVNGDMKFPRRGAEAVTINNGRVFVLGGLNATGGALSELEIYTPRGGLNFRPSARTDLESRRQSWAFGAPIVFRLTDAELDDARVVVQWSDNGGATWNAAAPQATTIGGDVAEATAPLTTGLADNESLAISPAAYPQSDHKYIWAMSEDIVRPPEGQTSGPFIFRAIPFGAVQGTAAQSVPVTVLYNTKVIPTIVPLSSRDGVEGAEQGGDIHIWVHFRDVDGAVKPGPGDPAQAIFEYAVDANKDGSINDGQEFWQPMSRSGAAKIPARRQDNLLTGITTYSESFADSGPEFESRTAEQGWAMFPWDSVFDLGAPASSRADIFIRVRPFDNLTAPEPDEGFTRLLFNEANQPESFRLIRDPEALWLDSFQPSGGNQLAVSVTEPLEFHFNGLVDATSVNHNTIQIRLGGTQILGVFTTEQDIDAHTSLVTFYPQPNSTVLDELVHSPQDNPTVLFPFNTYSIFIPGYHAGEDYPQAVATLQPDLSAFPSEPDETFRLVQNVPINTSFTTGAGNYDDGQAVSVTATDPVGGSTLDSGDGFVLSYSGGLDLDTVGSPNLKLTVDNENGSGSGHADRPVVPFRRTITNTQDPVTGLVTSTVVITPLHPLPAGRTVDLETAAGMRGQNGRSVETSLLTYTVDDYGTKNVTYREDFDDDTYEDASLQNHANWGKDLCNPEVLTGLQGSSTAPQGGPDLVVGDGQVATITNAVSDYGNIIVNKGGTLRIRASTAATIRATGNITIAGVLDFRGEGGWSSVNGNITGSYYLYVAPRGTTGTRDGGKAYNGGGDGGDSSDSSSGLRIEGDDGEGNEYGEGGQVAGVTSYYVYGAGGGAGAGHGAEGFPGGVSAAISSNVNTNNNYGRQSIPGGVTGDPDMITGPSTGSGGGGGGSASYYPSTSSPWYHSGGGGGAGAGAVTIVCNGVFDLQPSGYIDGRGGDGGVSNHYAGSGGGGSGGGLKVTSGSEARLNGIIDLSGGKGGPRQNVYFSDYYNRYQYYVGTQRHGGDGGPGRFVVQAPNFAEKDEVRVKGQLMIQKIDELPSPSGSPGTVPSTFANGGSIDYGNTSSVYYNELVVPAGKAVNVTGNKALTIYADKVDIQGTLRINGQEPRYGNSTTEGPQVYGYAPIRDYFNSSSLTAVPPTDHFGAVGELGSGNGGDGYIRSGTPSQANIYFGAGTDGTGPSKGTNAHATNSGYSYSYSSGSYGYSYYYYTYGDAGGGGGGNATDGDWGWCQYTQGGYYNPLGITNETDKDGRSMTSIQSDSDNGGDRLDPTNISVDNLDQFVGSGGGGGNASRYRYYYQSGSYTYSYNRYGMSASGGSGAGALALVSTDTLSVGGTIEANGGPGNIVGDNYYYYAYTHSGGGGGSGGTVLLVGDKVEIEPVTNIQSSSSGATFEMKGGMGGGWRNRWTTNTNQCRYPAYTSAGNYGGDGGFGRLVIQYKTSLNDGAALFNRGGMEHVAFDDIYWSYSVFAGSARAQCLGGTNGGNFRSTWYDLESISPIVNGLAAQVVGPNTTHTIQGEGAQSHPHNLGAGTGEPDPNNTSGLQNPGSAFLDGWRFFRINGAMSRTSTDPTKPPPYLDNVEWGVVTDDR